MAPPPSPGTAELPGGSGQKRSVTKTVKTTTTTTRRRDPPGRYGPPPEQTSALVDEIFKMLQEPLPGARYSVDGDAAAWRRPHTRARRGAENRAPVRSSVVARRELRARRRVAGRRVAGH